MNLLHNVPIDVPKSFKREILKNIQAYNNTNTHHITVKSTFPFTAIDHKSTEHRGKGQELQFMEVMAKIEIAFGSSNQGGLNKQLLCNPCFMGEYYSYTKDSTDNDSNSFDMSSEGVVGLASAGNIVEG